MAPPYSNPALPAGSLVVVTGANGYIGSHIVDQLLGAGCRVRGTVRDTAKAVWMNEFFEEKYGKGLYETIVVKNMAEAGCFDEAVKGAAGFVHSASVLTFAKDPNQVIPDVIAGVQNALKAAASEKSIKRFVHTSSSAALANVKNNVEFSFDENTWNDEAVKLAWEEPFDKPGHQWIVYNASKTEAERYLWKFMEKEKPGFVANTVCPNCNFGTILSDKQPASTAGFAKAVFFGKMEAVEGFLPQWFIDVQDTARLHVAGLLNTDLANERILGFAEPFNWSDMLAVFRKQFPDRQFADDIPNESRDLSKVPTKKGAELLKAFGRDGWTSFEESVKNTVAGVAC